MISGSGGFLGPIGTRRFLGGLRHLTGLGFQTRGFGRFGFLCGLGFLVGLRFQTRGFGRFGFLCGRGFGLLVSLRLPLETLPGFRSAPRRFLRRTAGGFFMRLGFLGRRREDFVRDNAFRRFRFG